MVFNLVQLFKKILRIPNLRSFFLQHKWLLCYQQFCEFSLNKSCKTYLETILPTGGRNQQLIPPSFFLQQFVANTFKSTGDEREVRVGVAACIKLQKKLQRSKLTLNNFTSLQKYKPSNKLTALNLQLQQLNELRHPTVVQSGNLPVLQQILKDIVRRPLISKRLPDDQFINTF